MDTRAKRVQYVMEKCDLEPEDVINITGATKSTVYRWMNNESQPYPKYLKKLGSHTGYRWEWLKTGGGEKEAPAPSTETGDSFTLRIFYDVRPSAGNGRLIYGADEQDEAQLEESKQLFKGLLGFRPPDDLRGVYIDGRSMAPMFQDGQLVLYEPVERMESGERYVLLVEDQTTGDWNLLFKRVQVFTGGGLKLISENPGLGLDDETLLPDDDGKLIHQTTGLPVNVRVVGRVLWPSGRDEARQVQLVTQTIERLASAGVIARPS